MKQTMRIDRWTKTDNECSISSLKVIQVKQKKLKWFRPYKKSIKLLKNLFCYCLLIFLLYTYFFSISDTANKYQKGNYPFYERRDQMPYSSPILVYLFNPPASQGCNVILKISWELISFFLSSIILFFFLIPTELVSSS